MKRQHLTEIYALHKIRITPGYGANTGAVKLVLLWMLAQPFHMQTSHPGRLLCPQWMGVRSLDQLTAAQEKVRNITVAPQWTQNVFIRKV